MTIIFYILLFISGVGFLLKGTSWFAEGLVVLLGKLRVPPILTGITFISLRTSLPLLALLVASCLMGLPELTVGAVVGTNLAILGLLFGIGGNAAFIPLRKELINKELPLLVIVMVILINFSMDYRLSNLEGISLIIIFILYIRIIFNRGQRPPEICVRELSLFQIVAYTSAGICSISIGTFIYFYTLYHLSVCFNITPLLLSATLGSLAISFPVALDLGRGLESRKYQFNAAYFFGSIMFNNCVILGLLSFYQPLYFSLETIMEKKVLWIMVLFALALIPIAQLGSKRGLDRKKGIILLLGYLLAFQYLLH